MLERLVRQGAFKRLRQAMFVRPRERACPLSEGEVCSLKGVALRAHAAATHISNPRGSPANLPLAFIYHPCLKTTPEDDRKRGTGAANLERVKEQPASLIDKKMLSAIRKMSNIFLHLGLNIEMT